MLVGLSETEALVTGELYALFLVRIIDDHEDFLVAHIGHFDRFFEYAAPSFAEGYIALVVVRDPLALVHFASSHVQVG